MYSIGYNGLQPCCYREKFNPPTMTCVSIRNLAVFLVPMIFTRADGACSYVPCRTAPPVCAMP